MSLQWEWRLMMLKDHAELVRDQVGAVVLAPVAGPGLMKGLCVGLVLVVPFWAAVANLAMSVI